MKIYAAVTWDLHNNPQSRDIFPVTWQKLPFIRTVCLCDYNLNTSVPASCVLPQSVSLTHLLTDPLGLGWANVL